MNIGMNRFKEVPRSEPPHHAEAASSVQSATEELPVAGLTRRSCIAREYQILSGETACSGMGGCTSPTHAGQSSHETAATSGAGEMGSATST